MTPGNAVPQVLRETDARFVAEWVHADHEDPETGEFDPDATEYGKSIHATLSEAQAAAIASGKARDVADWVAVREMHFNRELGISPRSDAAWDVVRSWYGDLDGYWSEA